MLKDWRKVTKPLIHVHIYIKSSVSPDSSRKICLYVPRVWVCGIGVRAGQEGMVCTAHAPYDKQYPVRWWRIRLLQGIWPFGWWGRGGDLAKWDFHIIAVQKRNRSMFTMYRNHPFTVVFRIRIWIRMKWHAYSESGSVLGLRIRIK